MGYCEFEELMQNSKNGSMRNKKLKRRQNEKKPLTQAQLHKLLRDAKEKHDIQQE